MSHFQTPTTNLFSFFEEETSSHAPVRHENISRDERFPNIPFQHPIQEFHQNMEGDLDDTSHARPMNAPNIYGVHYQWRNSMRNRRP